MTSSNPHRLDAVATREHGPDLHAVVVLAREREEDSAAPVIAGSNVVPFARPRRDSATTTPAPAFTVDPAGRPVPQLTERTGRVRILALFAFSLAAHCGLYGVFNRAPEPMSSIGLEAISVEIVLGANTPAGLAVVPGENAVPNAPAEDPDPKPRETETATAKLEPAADAKPVQDAQPPPPEARVRETPPEPEQQQPVALPVEPPPALAVAPPEPDRSETVRPQPKPEQPAQRRETTPKPERAAARSKTASTHPDAAAPRSNAANGVGAGRSQSNANYHGLVAAHLARYQRYPLEARNRGEQGRATVGFSLDGGGSVTRVTVVRGTGFVSLDQEMQAMVRRASPFPAPPDGRAMSFTQSVNFSIR